ncbi:MAG: hypothetical protein QOD04_5345, partial [Pseudonocardiales bacterium]|nr:hypothetical protein [Pseudonocardiales bacterium]
GRDQGGDQDGRRGPAEADERRQPGWLHAKIFGHRRPVGRPRHAVRSARRGDLRAVTTKTAEQISPKQPAARRVPGGELVRDLPVRGRALAVEQTGGGDEPGTWNVCGAGSGETAPSTASPTPRFDVTSSPVGDSSTIAAVPARPDLRDSWPDRCGVKRGMVGSMDAHIPVTVPGRRRGHVRGHRGAAGS